MKFTALDVITGKAHGPLYIQTPCGPRPVIDVTDMASVGYSPCGIKITYETDDRATTYMYGLLSTVIGTLDEFDAHEHDPLCSEVCCLR